MSQVKSDVDLTALQRPEAALRPQRRSKLRILVPLVLLVGFAAVLTSTLTDLFATVHDVTVVRPTRPNAEQVAALGEGTVVVQASGWVEPDPFPVHVAALAEGVVEELYVQESDVVEEGQVIARLVDEDARIARDGVAAELAIRQAELAQATAQLTIADERLEACARAAERVDALHASLDAGPVSLGALGEAAQVGEAV